MSSGPKHPPHSKVTECPAGRNCQVLPLATGTQKLSLPKLETMCSPCAALAEASAAPSGLFFPLQNPLPRTQWTNYRGERNEAPHPPTSWQGSLLASPLALSAQGNEGTSSSKMAEKPNSLFLGELFPYKSEKKGRTRRGSHLLWLLATGESEENGDLRDTCPGEASPAGPNVLRPFKIKPRLRRMQGWVEGWPRLPLFT